jgi:hypothetical protein
LKVPPRGAVKPSAFNSPASWRKLTAKQAQGAQLGTPANLTPAATQKGRDHNQAKAHANEHNERAAAHILVLREKGFNYSQIAEKLNALRFLTRTGKAFRAEQVKRLYLRATALALDSKEI